MEKISEKKNYQVMETSKKIADKAHALFIRYGIRSISMDDIAADLGISKKTIYQFYSNKDSLVEALVDKAIGKHTFRCKALMEKSDDAIIELYFLLGYAREFYNILNPAIIYDLKKKYVSAYKKLEDHKSVFLHQTFKASIERGIKMGLYRDDFDIDLITRFFIESLALILDPGIFHTTHHAKIKQSEELFAYLINGIVTTTGMGVVNICKNQKVIMLLSTYEDGPF